MEAAYQAPAPKIRKACGRTRTLIVSELHTIVQTLYQELASHNVTVDWNTVAGTVRPGLDGSQLVKLLQNYGAGWDQVAQPAQVEEPAVMQAAKRPGPRKRTSSQAEGIRLYLGTNFPAGLHDGRKKQCSAVSLRNIKVPNYKIEDDVNEDVAGDSTSGDEVHDNDNADQTGVEQCMPKARNIQQTTFQNTIATQAPLHTSYTLASLPQMTSHARLQSQSGTQLPSAVNFHNTFAADGQNQSPYQFTNAGHLGNMPKSAQGRRDSMLMPSPPLVYQPVDSWVNQLNRQTSSVEAAPNRRHSTGSSLGQPEFPQNALYNVHNAIPFLPADYMHTAYTTQMSIHSQPSQTQHTHNQNLQDWPSQSSELSDNLYFGSLVPHNSMGNAATTLDQVPRLPFQSQNNPLELSWSISLPSADPLHLPHPALPGADAYGQGYEWQLVNDGIPLPSHQGFNLPDGSAAQHNTLENAGTVYPIDTLLNLD